MDLIEEFETNDQVSLEIYGQTACHEVNLTTDSDVVEQRLWEMQAGHYDTWTNMGGGLDKAIQELNSDRARQNAARVIFLMTDGIANVSSSGEISTSGGCAYSLSKAQEAAAQGIQIHCISVGANANRDLMQEIATIGSGEEFFASGTIDQYSDQLMAIFGELGLKRPVSLLD